MTRIQKRIDSFLYDTGGYSTQRIAVHGGRGFTSRFCHFVTNPILLSTGGGALPDGTHSCLGHVSNVFGRRGRRGRGVYHAYSASRSRADRVRELQ